MDDPNARGGLVWMDLEMTGLNPDADVILEIATLVTDSDLAVIAEGPTLAIHHDEEALSRMDEWNVQHHTASGLLGRVRRSEVSTVEAEAVTLSFIERHCARQSSPLCGNTIWQDRRFLLRHMPVLGDYLHYRIIDVSTVKELARRWRPALLTSFHKRGAHRALDDIRESVAELRHYRDAFFRTGDD
jgi:oligoribonuclease